MPENTVRFESSARVRARHARSSSSRWSGERPVSCIALISGSGRRWPVSRLLSGTILILVLIALYRSSCTLVYCPLKYRGGGSCGEKNVPKR